MAEYKKIKGKNDRRGRKVLAEQKRKKHAVYFSDEEWKIITEKAVSLDMDRGVFLRAVSLGYKPQKPDPELRHELMNIRHDISSLFHILRHLNLATEERWKYITEIDFLRRWEGCVETELSFIDFWIKNI